jgi:hypothetical protein
MDYLDKTVAGKVGVLPKLVMWPWRDSCTPCMPVQSAG